MSKRFTDSQKWTAKPWFRKLSPQAKLLWLYACDTCDVAGVIDLDTEMASFLIGAKVTQKHVKELEKQFVALGGCRYWIRDFVPFQCGELKESCPPHRKVISLLKGYRKGTDTLLEELNSLSTTLSIRVQEEEEEKEDDIEGEGEKEERRTRNSIPPRLEEVSEYCNQRANGIDPQSFIDHYTSNGWVVGKSKMKDWQAAIRTWEKSRKSNQPELFPESQELFKLFYPNLCKIEERTSQPVAMLTKLKLLLQRMEAEEGYDTAKTHITNWMTCYEYYRQYLKTAPFDLLWPQESWTKIQGACLAEHEKAKTGMSIEDYCYREISRKRNSK